MQADRSTDWFGMVMTGPDIPVSFDLKGGEPAYLEVRIDPAAHGEAGLGPIQRGVEVKLAGGQTFAVTLTATIVK